MALMLEVAPVENVLRVSGFWEDGRYWRQSLVAREENMTAAESVEFYMLKQGFVASWGWRRSGQRLIGQFVNDHSAKEVFNSNANLFDL